MTHKKWVKSQWVFKSVITYGLLNKEITFKQEILSMFYCCETTQLIPNRATLPVVYHLILNFILTKCLSFMKKIVLGE